MQKVYQFIKSSHWGKVFLIILLLLIFTAIYIFWPVNVDLSHLEVPSDTYDVTIYRDTWGVPHVYGQKDADVAFGLAYAHAEDDFLTIQQSLVTAKGMLAQVYGMDAAANDYMVQLLRIWDVGDRKYFTDLTDSSRAIFEAYAEGMNHYAALHPDEVLLEDAFPVTGKDLVAASVHKSPLFFGLDGTLGELFAKERQSEVSVEPEVWQQFSNFQYGSNTIAVGPGRTSDGSTFFAVNSHQPWEGPVAWYEAHLHSEEGWNMVGALFPGTPVIIHGHNRYLGWAFTVNAADLADVYVLEINPDNEDQYLYDGEWVDFEIRDAKIKVRLAGRLSITVTREVLWSEYGPTVRQDHGVYALRYAGFGRVDIFQQLYQMNKATNFEEWQEAIYNGALPTFNVGYADKEGNIYYLYNASLPIRAAGYDWSLYLPGVSSELKWTEYLPFDQLPQVLNPPSDFIQNANSSPFLTTIGPGNPSPDDYMPGFGIETYPTNRALRLLELLEADESITFDEFLAYKFDQNYHTETNVGELVEMISEMDSSDPLFKEAQKLVADWDFNTSSENTRAALVILTLYNLSAEIEGFDGSSLVRNEFTQAQAEEAFRQAIIYLDENFGKLDVPRGEVQRLRRGDFDLPIGGGPDILNAAYSFFDEEGIMLANSGDSYVLIVAWDPDGNLKSFSIHQFGSATLDQFSPHYNDQSVLFVKRELKPIWFELEDILANLESEYAPGEE